MNKHVAKPISFLIGFMHRHRRAARFEVQILGIFQCAKLRCLARVFVKFGVISEYKGQDE